MTEKYVLALDQGTTSSRAILVDRRGAIIASEQQEFAQIYPQPGLVEHDALEIWSSQLAVARAVVAKAGLTGNAIAAIGITNQRETTVRSHSWSRRLGQPASGAWRSPEIW